MELRQIKSDIRGKGSMDMTTKFMSSLLVVVILGFILIVIGANLRTASEDVLPTLSGTVSNETLSTINEATPANFDVQTYTNVVCTNQIFTNSTNLGDESAIDSNNYTLSNNGCSVVYSGVPDTTGYNNTAWNVSYAYTYQEPYASTALQNTTSGTSDFFSNIPTWFSMLSVVIIITLIIVVVTVAKKASSGSSSRGKGGIGGDL